MPAFWQHTSDPTTVRLLIRIHEGDSGAINQLFARYWPRLYWWIHGRVPVWARGDADTPDFVQDICARSVGRLQSLNPKTREALQAYFRTAVRNRIRDEYRRHGRRAEVPLPPSLDACDIAPSALDRVIEDEEYAIYRAALTHLDEDDRDLIVGHLELNYTHAQLGCMTNRTSNGARMALHRAIGRLVARIHER